MIGKLFKKKSQPNNVGTGIPQNGVSHRNIYYLCLQSLEGEPTHELQESLSIGSGDTDIVIDDESISGNHCTVFLDQDVISVIDHNSEEGTLINGRELMPGRMYILRPDDIIQVGELEVNIIVEQREDESEVLEPTGDIDLTGLEEQEVEPTEEPSQEIENEALEATGDIDITEVNEPDEAADLEQLDEDDSELDLTSESKPSFLQKIFKKNKDDLEDFEEFEEEPEQAKTSTFHKLFNKVKPPVKASANEKRDLNLTISYDYAGSILRVVALIFDFVLSATVSYLVMPLNILEKLEFLNFKDKFNESFLKVYGLIEEQKFLGENELKILVKVKDDIISFLSSNGFISLTILVFIAIRVITPLIFGVSISQSLMGLRGTKSFLLKRLLGPVREVFGFLFLPLFFITSIGTLIGKRTLQEVITLTGIERRGVGLHTLLSFLTFFILSLVVLVAPLFKGLAPLKSLKYKGAQKIELAEEQPKESKILHLQMVQGLSKSTYPQLIAYKTQDITKYRVRFNFFDEANNLEHIEKIYTGDTKDLFHLGLADNFLSFYYYPKLDVVVKSSQKLKKQSFEQINNEMISFLDTTLSIGIDTIIDKAQVSGPFLYGNVSFRDFIEEIIKDKIVSYQKIQIEKLPLVYGFISKSGKSFIFSFQSNKTYIYEVSNFSIFGKYLSNSYQNLEQDNTEKLDLISFFDRVVSSDVDRSFYDQSEILFKDISKELLGEGDDKNIELYLNTLDSVGSYLENFENELNENLFKSVVDMQKALEDRDINFFNQKPVKKVRK